MSYLFEIGKQINTPLFCPVPSLTSCRAFRLPCTGCKLCFRVELYSLPNYEGAGGAEANALLSSSDYKRPFTTLAHLITTPSPIPTGPSRRNDQ